MASENDNLRRSKRNKYHLDILNLSGLSEKKSSKPAVVPSTDDSASYATPSPGTSREKSSEEVSTDDNKRSRRPTAKNASFVYADESDDEDEKMTTGMAGAFKCDKCPSRFESRPGLANHVRLHGSDKRKFGCDSCDFSCGSAKAIRNHKKVHNRPFKDSTPVPTASDNRSDTSESHTPPLLTPVRAEPPGTLVTPPNGPPPQLEAITPPPKQAGDDRTSNRPKRDKKKRHRCPECPFAVHNHRRLEHHLKMHSRRVGFQCHACSLTTLSPGFLKRHITNVHKETDFPWPPKFIKNGERDVEDVEREKSNEKKKQTRALVLMTSVKRNGELLYCPVENCNYQCYMMCQLAIHKRNRHIDKEAEKNKRIYRCCGCGLKLRTPGALRVHRIRMHPIKKLTQKKKKIYFREILCSILRKNYYSEVKNNKMDSSSPPSTLTTSQSAPVLTAMDNENVSTLILGVELPDCLKGVSYAASDLASELESNLQSDFTCKECPFGTNARAKHERHVVKHEIKSDLQCPLCSFSCRGDDLIKQHVRLHMAIIHQKRLEAEKIVADSLPQLSATPSKSGSPSSSQTSPPKLDKVSPKKKRKSAFIITKDGIRMRQCQECPYVTKHACDLASHYSMHAGEPSRFKCTQCSYSTKRAVCLKTHFQVHKDQNAEQMSVKPTTMKLNGITVGTRCGQGKNLIYMCNKCPFVTKSVVALNQHYRNHLSFKGANFKCSKCSFFSIKNELVEEHILLHEDVNVKAERIGLLVKTKKGSSLETEGSTGRSTPVAKGKKSPPKNSAAPSPAPPVLAKEEPLNYSNNLEEEDSNSMDMFRPLSVICQDLLRPEPVLFRVIRREGNSEEIGQCPDCPFSEKDEMIMRLHRACHQFPPKPFACDLCNFSCMAPETLHHHIGIHIPQMSPNTERLERKKATLKRRTHQSEVIPVGTPHFACLKCSFKCLTKDSFETHMLQHAQELQRRLLTTMKRTNAPNDDKNRGRRIPKKSDRFFSCTKCSFRCETNSSKIRHMEKHGSNSIHTCEVCDYSDSTRSIIDYHQQTHHVDHSLASMTKAAILAPNVVRLNVDRSEKRIIELADQVYYCERCPQFKCYELLGLRRHYEDLHNETPDDKNAVESLALGMLPLNNSIITTA